MGYVLQIDHKADIPNAYSQAFRNKLVFDNFNGKFPHTLIKAIDTNAEKNYVESILQGSSVNYISASGHGEYDQLIGEDGLPVWEADPVSQPHLQPLAGTIVHLLSCGTGSYLGHVMIKFGVTSFWGYTSIFSFPRRAEFGSPENDFVAEPFFEMDAIIDRGILKGDSAQVIYGDVSTYVAQTLPSLSHDDRVIFLDNYMIIVCPVHDWGDSFAVLT
jgi:hypothetical protein